MVKKGESRGRTTAECHFYHVSYIHYLYRRTSILSLSHYQGALFDLSGTHEATSLRTRLRHGVAIGVAVKALIVGRAGRGAEQASCGPPWALSVINVKGADKPSCAHFTAQTDRTRPSFSLAMPTNYTILPITTRACADIESCRTLPNIVLSCLATIFACVWTAVHRNIARPSRDWRSRLLNLVDMAKVVFVTLLVPECPGVGDSPKPERTSHRQGFDDRPRCCKRCLDEEEATDGVANRCKEYVPQQISILLRTKTQIPWRSSAVPVEDNGLTFSEIELDEVSRLSAEWTIRHGFFIIMGGYHFYEGGKPVHPLDWWTVVDLVKAGNLILPAEEDIQALGQADALSKGLAVLQTMWFVVQCIARRAAGLPITQLEVVTLAYTTITFAMYVAWWSKPLNVGGRIHFVGKLPARRKGRPQNGWVHLVNLVIGDQDYEVDMRSASCVPAFFGGPTGNEHIHADAVSLFMATIFGAIHSAAWRYAFPSLTEAIVWRVSSATITALPGLLCLYLLWELSPCGDSHRVYFANRNTVFMLFTIPFGAVYVLTRLILLTLAFTTLRSLPFAAYRSIPWAQIIPHLS
ncbi:hypothetical protein FA95DRAFT_673885 [Auriscalpium vulgare]|uniref:Uncharacterized protein n=1 Tax=Auriscalpium vulgare TaxID=40419 RepID=A0ACB8RC12_9AGAM|nr:hypothetical protein FA95DRAFT_673885 [Auriscalpium vulgare]